MHEYCKWISPFPAPFPKWPPVDSYKITAAHNETLSSFCCLVSDNLPLRLASCTSQSNRILSKSLSDIFDSWFSCCNNMTQWLTWYQTPPNTFQWHELIWHPGKLWNIKEISVTLETLFSVLHTYTLTHQRSAAPQGFPDYSCDQWDQPSAWPSIQPLLYLLLFFKSLPPVGALLSLNLSIFLIQRPSTVARCPHRVADFSTNNQCGWMSETISIRLREGQCVSPQ